MINALAVIIFLSALVNFPESSLASAFTLENYDDVNVVAAQYGVAKSELLQISDVQGSDAPKQSVEGPTRLIRINGQDEMFFLYGSRIQYIKGKSTLEVARAFELTSLLPVPPPVDKIWNRKVQVLTANHLFTTYGIQASMSKAIVKLTTNCEGATHGVLFSNGDFLVQNKWSNCSDQKDAVKVWFPYGWQSNRIIAISEGQLAVLSHNLLIVRRHKIGIFKPTEADIFEMATKASEQTHKGFMDRLKN